ncbi:NAD(P)-dependent oxidoreductase [Quatrionicoccus australiensis]|uniref:NAD(P)-dependent oxidoreductase n=1 Tax=Quatrionicoccus australiensis TaxID=138118 RepID=UPI001CF9AA81|nr:NAD(P)-dependent oxidoreductase [Quatrionicoccus australiensis]MCB4359312.1 NAD(P)-dependent oxidoreductase [Quatrionicoccus australiensis]
MKVGFIGLGVMGRPMALHLQRAGHELHVWARRPASAAGLPAILHATPAELGRACEVVFTVITSSADVDAVALGPDGLIEGMAPGSVLIDCSTIAPDVARRIADELGRTGIAMLDAPVSGGAQGAIDATLAIMAGGDAAVLERVRPLLDCLGKRIVHVGPNGAGQVAKACNQMIMVAAIQAAAEAMHLARAAGVDCGKVRDALAGGSAGSRVLDVMGQRMVERDFAAGIEARLHHKDFGLVLEAARKSGVPVPLTAAVAQQLNSLMAQGWGGDDTASLLRVLEVNS